MDAYSNPKGESKSSDLTQLDQRAAEIRRLGKRAIGDIIEIGRLLTECKALVGHGHWLPWLEREFAWSVATATNYMRVFELSKIATVTDLPIDAKALYLIAAPSTPREVRIEIANRAKAGEKITTAVVTSAVQALVKPTVPHVKPATAPDITDAWERAPPAERKRFLDGVGFKAVVACFPDSWDRTLEGWLQARQQRRPANCVELRDRLAIATKTAPDIAALEQAPFDYPELPVHLDRAKAAKAKPRQLNIEDAIKNSA